MVGHGDQERSGGWNLRECGGRVVTSWPRARLRGHNWRQWGPSAARARAPASVARRGGGPQGGDCGEQVHLQVSHALCRLRSACHPVTSGELLLSLCNHSLARTAGNIMKFSYLFIHSFTYLAASHDVDLVGLKLTEPGLNLPPRSWD